MKRIASNGLSSTGLAHRAAVEYETKAFNNSASRVRDNLLYVVLAMVVHAGPKWIHLIRRQDGKR